MLDVTLFQGDPGQMSHGDIQALKTTQASLKVAGLMALGASLAILVLVVLGVGVRLAPELVAWVALVLVALVLGLVALVGLACALLAGFLGLRKDAWVQAEAEEDAQRRGKR